MSNSDKKESFIDNKWRPIGAWNYIAICCADFIVFPILWSVTQMVVNGAVESQWTPITLQGGGILHLSLGALLTVTSYGRTREKLSRINDVQSQPSMPDSLSSSVAEIMISRTGKPMPIQPDEPER